MRIRVSNFIDILVQLQKMYQDNDCEILETLSDWIRLKFTMPSRKLQSSSSKICSHARDVRMMNTIEPFNNKERKCGLKS